MTDPSGVFAVGLSVTPAAGVMRAVDRAGSDRIGACCPQALVTVLSSRPADGLALTAASGGEPTAMTSILQAEPIGKVVVGVDTHKYIHTAVAVDVVGGVRGTTSVSCPPTVAAMNNSTPGPASSAKSTPSAWRAPAPTAPDSPPTCADTATSW